MLIDTARTATPTVQAVTLAEAKAHLKVLHTSEDAAIGQFVAASIAEFELRTGRALALQTWTGHLSAFPAAREIRLPMAGFKDLTSLTYIDADGASQTLSPSLLVAVATLNGARLVLKPGASWPVTGEHPHAVTVTWRCGNDDSATIDATIRACILLMTAQKYMNREGPSDERRASTATMSSIESLLRLHSTTGWI